MGAPTKDTKSKKSQDSAAVGLETKDLDIVSFFEEVSTTPIEESISTEIAVEESKKDGLQSDIPDEREHKSEGQTLDIAQADDTADSVQLVNDTKARCSPSSSSFGTKELLSSSEIVDFVTPKGIAIENIIKESEAELGASGVAQEKAHGIQKLVNENEPRTSKVDENGPPTSEVDDFRASVESILDFFAGGLVKMTEQYEKLKTGAGMRAELEALRQRHSEALELVAERDEEPEELHANIVELKEKLEEHVNLLSPQRKCGNQHLPSSSNTTMDLPREDHELINHSNFVYDLM